MANLNAPMPTYFTPFLKEDGRVNEPWYRYLFQLQLRTGGAAGNDFQSEIDALTKQVVAQDLEINGLYPSPTTPQSSDDIGIAPFQIIQQIAMDDGLTPITPGTLGTQNSDFVSITGGSIDGTTIGGTTPNIGAFTTISATNTITPSQTFGIVGTNTNNNANAGSFGEYLTGVGSPTFTTAVANNAASLSLTAGDWDVSGTIQFTVSAASTATRFVTSINTTSATINPNAQNNHDSCIISAPGLDSFSRPTPVVRISIASTTTVYLVGIAFFSGTVTGNGFIRARRIR